jgi:hypothetical protein
METLGPLSEYQRKIDNEKLKPDQDQLRAIVFVFFF